MKRLLFVLLLLASGLRAAGQNTTISSSMVDTDGIAWANGTWKIDFRPNPAYPNESTYRLLNGQPLAASTTHQNGVLDASGHFSVTIYDSTLIAPTGSGWTITLCPLASAPCGTYQFTSAGASMDISSRLTTSIAAPRFPPNNGAFGYADVEVQTSLNQGASYWNVTAGTQHIWNGQTWIAGGGGASFPGVTPDGNTPPGIIVQGAVTASALPGYKASPDAPSTNRDQKLAVTVTPQDFCPNAGSGVTSDTQCFYKAMRWLASYNTNNTNIPRRLVIPWTPQGYYFANWDYQALATMPYDFGDYHGSAGYATQAAVNVYFTNGLLTSCAITGGSGYAPNAKLPIQIIDPAHAGSGAAAYVLTNNVGVPASSCVIQLQGINYTVPGVLANVIPLGGDGAAGTITLSAGTFSAPVITNGGYGYNSGSNNPQTTIVMVTGVSCSTYPIMNGTVTNAQVTGITFYNNTTGTNCYVSTTGSISLSTPTTLTVANAINISNGAIITIAGAGVSGANLTTTVTGGATNTLGSQNLTIATAASTAVGPTASVTTSTAAGSTTTVQLVFGASCTYNGIPGQQCQLMDPETPVNMPISIPLYNGVEIVGVGNPALVADCGTSGAYCGQSGDYSPGAPVCNSAPPLNCQITDAALIGDPWGDQLAQRGDIAAGGYGLVYPLTYGSPLPFISNLTLLGDFDLWLPYISGGNFNNLTLQGGVAAYIGTINGGVTQQVNFRDDRIYSAAGLLIGGDWAFRNPGVAINAGYGRYIGWSNGSRGGNMYSRPNNSSSGAFGGSGALNMENIIAYQTLYNLTQTGWDKWVEQYLWKSQNSPAAPYTDTGHLLSNAGTSCPTAISPALTNTGRATEVGFTPTSFNAFYDYPWFNCFRGVRDSLVMAQPRYSHLNGAYQGVVTAPGDDGYSFRLVNSRMTNYVRPIFQGQVQSVLIKNVFSNNTSAYPTDPMLPTGVNATAIWLLTAGHVSYAPPTGSIEDINFGAFANSHALQALYFGVPFSVPYNTFSISKLALRSVQALPDKLTLVAGVLYSGTQSVANASNQYVYPQNSVTLGQGTYRVVEYGWVTAPVAAGTMSMCVIWNDGTATNTGNCPVSGQAAATTGAHSILPTQVFHSVNNGLLNIYNSCVSSTCSFDWIVERLQ